MSSASITFQILQSYIQTLFLALTLSKAAFIRSTTSPNATLEFVEEVVAIDVGAVEGPAGGEGVREWLPRDPKRRVNRSTGIRTWVLRIKAGDAEVAGSSKNEGSVDFG